MAKKVILKDDNVEIMPITRGELVLDSSGQQAFHSSQFLATHSQPGLMSGEDKTKLDSLEKAGYFKFVLPTLLWQCGLALLISGFVAVFFYFTWTYEEEAKTPKKLKKNKAKK